MSTETQAVQAPSRPRRKVIRWALKIAAMVIGVMAVVDLVITLIPEPGPRRQNFSSGGNVTVSSYSETDDAIVDAKNRVQSYLSPVGWAALRKGHGPDSLYILKRDESWKAALETGQVMTLFVLLALPFPLWVISMRIGRPKHP